MLIQRKDHDALSGELLEEARFAVAVIGGLEMLLGGARIAPAAAILGLATVAASRVPALYEWLRFVAAGSVCAWLLVTSDSLEALTVTLALAFLLPSQATVPSLLAALVFRSHWPAPLIALAAAGVAWLHERQRLAQRASHLRLVQSTQELRVEQARALTAEHAASLERFAAAISHELNTPVGAIRSSVQTLRSITRTFVSDSDTERQRAAAIHDELTKLLLTSTERVQGIVSRLQRLTSLDRALLRPTDVNTILRDVAATVESEVSSGAAIRLNLLSLPTVVCEAQAWTTILNRLITVAVAQRDQRLIDISTDFEDGHIVIDIVEVGRETATAPSLDPAFVKTGNRIGTTNWTMFQIRSWIQQLGGDVKQFCDLPRGLTTRVLIPAKDPLP